MNKVKSKTAGGLALTLPVAAAALYISERPAAAEYGNDCGGNQCLVPSYGSCYGIGSELGQVQEDWLNCKAENEDYFCFAGEDGAEWNCGPS